MPDDRVLVFDPLFYDVKTPSSITMKPATIVCRYGIKEPKNKFHPADWIYEDLIDVRFDHRPERISYGHFTSGIKPINE